MNQFNKDSYILTRDGYKPSNLIKIGEFISSGKKYNKVLFTSAFNQPLNLTQYYYLQTSIHCFSTLLHHSYSTLVVNKDTFQKEYKNIKTINIDDWLFNPWVYEDKSNSDDKITKLDLTKYTDGFQNLSEIFMFDNSILNISKDLNIPIKALKQLLIREAAEYDHYLDKLKNYIYDKYNIKEQEAELTSFKEFKQYVKNTFVSSMPRFITLNDNFISFLISYLSSGYLHPSTNELGSCTSYKFSFLLEKTTTLYKETILFLKQNKISYKEVGVSGTTTNVIITNKPLYDFLYKSVTEDMSFILNINKELQNKFVNTLFQHTDEIFSSFNVALQLSLLFNLNKKVITINSSNIGVKLKLGEDDLSNVDSNLIITEDGFYTKVIGIYGAEHSSQNPKTTSKVSVEGSSYTTINSVIKV